MKASEVYLRAAIRMDNPQTGLCGICLAISETLGNDVGYNTQYHGVMAELFKWNINYFGHYEKKNREHRVLALCLMSAIAADEERK